MDDIKTQESECHILPCSLAFSGMAPIEHYFRPTTIPPLQTSRHLSPSDQNFSNNDETSRVPAYMAAQFRGRGLVAAVPTPRHGLSARLVTVRQESSNNKVSTCMETLGPAIENFVEWNHLHQQEAIKSQEGLRRFNPLQTAQEWQKVSRALHQPIIPPE